VTWSRGWDIEVGSSKPVSSPTDEGTERALDRVSMILSLNDEKRCFL